LGGVTQNYGTNFLINDKPEDVICVVEADEFDRSFLTLFPDLAIVTSTDADHLDIYQNHSNLLESFGLFVKQIKPNGKLFQHYGLDLQDKTTVQTHEYSIEKGDFKIENLTIVNAEMVFDIVTPQTRINQCSLQIPGFHNAENAMAAAAVCLELGLSEEKIKAGIAAFKGVKRRFEYHIRTQQMVYIDDYAHHPTEIEAFLKSIKALYPSKKITAVFQPHLYTRTRDFQEGFASSLSIADDVLLLDIYPARELPIEGVTSDIIFQNITSAQKILCAKENVLEILRSKQPELLVTIGAGDIDTLVPQIATMFLDK
jgi:UDP-N-acetylmuramate--alanine ligase